MNLQTQPNRWSCSVTAWAMAMHIPVETLMDAIGHDGSEIIFEELAEPMCRRGFHSQEMVWAAHNLGWHVMPIEMDPVIQASSGGRIHRITTGATPDYFEHLMSVTNGVLEGNTMRCKHAVAYSLGTIYDPNGKTYPATREAMLNNNFYGTRIWTFTR